MPTSIENALYTPVRQGTTGQAQQPPERSGADTGGKSGRSPGQSLRLPEDVVTLSTLRPDSGDGAERKKPSVAVTAGERTALLGEKRKPGGFSVYG